MISGKGDDSVSVNYFLNFEQRVTSSNSESFRLVRNSNCATVVVAENDDRLVYERGCENTLARDEEIVTVNESVHERAANGGENA